MNKCIFKGNFTNDPETRLSQDGEITITRFCLAVNRRFKRDGEPEADFPNFIAFGKNAENIGKFFVKGNPILVTAHLQTGSYTNREGKKVYTTDFIVEEWEFIGGKVEKKSSNEEPKDGEFMEIPENSKEELPWN